MKTLIATVLAATLALTTSAAPVQAGDREEEIGAILFGLATLAIIAKSLEDRQDDDRRPRAQVQVTPTYPRDGGIVLPRSHGPGAIPAHRRVLPRECFVRVDTRSGPVRMFGSRCLQNTYRFADQLPRRCLITLEGPRHTRTGYSPQCLRDRGFTMARH